MKQNKTILALLALGLPVGAAAQTAVTATGGTAEGGGYALTYSVGQVATAATTGGQLREGVVQPITVEEVGIAGCADVSSALTVYPNPTTDGVVVSWGDVGETPALQVRLYSLDGRLLRTEQRDGATLTLDLSAYAAGVYLLQVNNGRTFKITKQ